VVRLHLQANAEAKMTDETGPDETGPDETGPEADGARGRARRGSGAAEPVVVTARTARTGVQIRKKDFVDQVVAASGVKKADARAVLDAALALMADRVLAGDELVLPPLGRLRLLKERDKGKSRIATLRLQVATEGEGVTDPLAEAED
jgi:nucleoid DNA-binding protein